MWKNLLGNPSLTAALIDFQQVKLTTPIFTPRNVKVGVITLYETLLS